MNDLINGKPQRKRQNSYRRVDETFPCLWLSSVLESHRRAVKASVYAVEGIFRSDVQECHLAAGRPRLTGRCRPQLVHRGLFLQYRRTGGVVGVFDVEIVWRHHLHWYIVCGEQYISRTTLLLVIVPLLFFLCGFFLFFWGAAFSKLNLVTTTETNLHY